MCSIICVALVCATVIYCVREATKAYVIVQTPPSSEPTATLTQEDLDKAYDEADLPSFDDVIKFINEEYAGVNYGE